MNQAFNPYGYNNGYGGYSPLVLTPVQPMQPQPQPAPQQQQAQQQPGLPTFNRTVWAQGYEAAKSIPLSPGESVMILDSEADRFYIASAGQDGRPKPLRAFRFVKEDDPGQNADFVTRKEFDELKAALEALQAPQNAERDDGR